MVKLRVAGVDGGDGVGADAEVDRGEGGLAGSEGDGSAEVGDAVLELHGAGWAVPDAVVTVAVKDTDWPATDGFGPGGRMTVVDVGVSVWLTGWATAGEVLVVKLASPE